MTPDEARRRGTLSVDEAAALCGVGRDAMYSAVACGQVPRLPFPERTIRIPAGHLLEVLGYPTHEPTSRVAEGDNSRKDAELAPSAAVLPFGSAVSSTAGPQDHGVSAAVPHARAGER